MCKSLVVTQVEVSFRAVICDKDLAMLKGRHRARVNVDVRIELDQRDVESASFKQAANRRRCQAFSQTGNHAAGNKDIFSHCCLPSTFYLLPSTFSAHCSLLTPHCLLLLQSAVCSCFVAVPFGLLLVVAPFLEILLRFHSLCCCRIENLLQADKAGAQ